MQSANDPYIFLEDFTEGREFESGMHRMSASAIKAFARDFDPQPQHLDEAAAAASQFGGLVASGWHTASIAMRLFINALPPILGGAMGSGVEGLKWKKPVRPGDALNVKATVLTARPTKSVAGKGIVTCLIETFNDTGDLVLTFTTAMLVPARA